MLFVTALPFPALPPADPTLLSVYPRTSLRAAPALESHQHAQQRSWGHPSIPVPSNHATRRGQERAGTTFHKPGKEKRSPEQKNDAGSCSGPAISDRSRTVLSLFTPQHCKMQKLSSQWGKGTGVNGHHVSSVALAMGWSGPAHLGIVQGCAWGKSLATAHPAGTVSLLSPTAWHLGSDPAAVELALEDLPVSLSLLSGWGGGLRSTDTTPKCPLHALLSHRRASRGR